MPNRNPDRKAPLRGNCAKILFLLLSIPSVLTYALPDDRDQPIHITADKALRDEKKGVTIYSGNVQMNQGSMELEADKLTIYHPSDDAEKFIAEGNPAKMRQQPELNKGVVHAHARVIQYFRLENRVHLKTEASIEQDGAVVNGDTIDYFIDEQLIQAQSDQSHAGEQVIVVIPASTQPGEGSKMSGAATNNPDPIKATPTQGDNSPKNTTPDSAELADPLTTEQRENTDSGPTQSE